MKSSDQIITVCPSLVFIVLYDNPQPQLLAKKILWALKLPGYADCLTEMTKPDFSFDIPIIESC